MRPSLHLPATKSKSGVVVRLTAAEPERTTLELEHTAVVPEEMWPAFGCIAAEVELARLERASRKR